MRVLILNVGAIFFGNVTYDVLGSVAEGGHAGANWVRRSITINTGFGDKRFRDGNIEELLIHEGAHVSLDNYHKNVSTTCENRKSFNLNTF